MYDYHVREILEFYEWDKEYVIRTILKNNLSVSDDHFVAGWHEEIYPPWTAPSYRALMCRLDGHKYQYQKNEHSVVSWVVPSGRIYTNLVSPSGKKTNFQALGKRARHSVRWQGQELVGSDLSASQLRVALAIRGEFIDGSSSPWDNLVDRVATKVLGDVPKSKLRPFIKRVALQFVKGVKSIDLTSYWEEEVSIVPRPILKGVKAVIEGELIELYPSLRSNLPALIRTPDGYPIGMHVKPKDAANEFRFRTKRIKRSPSGRAIDTDYYLSVPSPLKSGHILEAMEAYILRQVINVVPVAHPVLPCHDELYVLQKDQDLIERAFAMHLKELAESMKN